MNNLDTKKLDTKDYSPYPVLLANTSKSVCYTRKGTTQKTNSSAEPFFKEKENESSTTPPRGKRSSLRLSTNGKKSKKTENEGEIDLRQQISNQEKAIANLKSKLKSNQQEAANELKKVKAEYEEKLRRNSRESNVSLSEELIPTDVKGTEQVHKPKWPTIRDMEHVLSVWDPMIKRIDQLNLDAGELTTKTDLLQKEMGKNEVKNLNEQAKELRNTYDELKSSIKDTKAIELIKLLMKIKKTVEGKRTQVPRNRLRSISARSGIPVKLLREQSQNYDDQFKKCQSQLEHIKIIFDNSLKNFEDSAYYLNIILSGVRSNLLNESQKETHNIEKLDRAIREIKEQINEKNIKFQNVRTTPQPSLFEYYFSNKKVETTETEEEKVKKEEEYQKAENKIKGEIDELTSQLQKHEEDIKLPKANLDILEKKIKEFMDVSTPYDKGFRHKYIK